ncbi:hypothetical protein HETIRDRAFT_240613, partial [Heterobasidion irregulare TC 32-1]
FSNGISTLSCVTGTKHKHICHTLLGLIIDLPLHNGYSLAHLVQSIHALLDFIYMAQFPLHTTQTLQYINKALKHFNIPKIHSLHYYTSYIKLFGTPDNYDIAYSEQLHINFTKDAYHANNKKNEYPQMT